MITASLLARHPSFEPWTDPASGAVSYILKGQVPLQKSFYFVNNSLSPDGRWLWFEYGYPPAPYKCLGAVCLDPETPEIRLFPHAAMNAETPVLDAQGNIYFSMEEASPEIWKMDISGALERFARLPESFVSGRTIRRVGTHFTLSADGTALLFDGKVGSVWYVALLDLATREIRVIKEFARHYNHAQFSPVDPGLFSIAQDHWRDPYTGQKFGYDHRIWLMTTDGTRFEPVEPAYYHSHQNAGNEVSHEWWAPDGTLCWIRYGEGAYAMNPVDRTIHHVWKRPVCHAHCDRSLRFWVADESPYRWPKPCKVLFFDRTSGKETEIVSGMPAPDVSRSAYHADPHPRFIDDDRCIVYTTTVRGRLDLALHPLEKET